MMSDKRTRTIIQCDHDHNTTTDHHCPSSSSPPPPPSFIKCADLILPYLTPQELANVSLTSKTLSKTARSVSLLRSLDASRTFENLPIPFHHHDGRREPPPPLYSYFLYTPSQLLPSQSFSRQPWGFPGRTVPGRTAPGRSVPDQPGNGVDCGGRKGIGPGWTEAGKVVIGGRDGLGEEEMGMGIMRECEAGCECGSECRNKLTQGGISVRLKIVWCEKKGWGLFADESIRRGTFVCEYAGRQCRMQNVINFLKLCCSCC